MVFAGDKDQVERKLIELNQLFSFSNGLLVLPPAAVSNNTVLLKEGVADSTAQHALTVPAPTTLYPTPFPKSLFNSSYDIQPIFNILIDKIAQDKQFLLEVLEPISEVDDFLFALLKIYKDIDEAKYQPIRLGIFRSDYLLHNGEDTFKEIEGRDIEAISNLFKSDKLKLLQVELNTIASSFGALASKTSELHQFLAARTNNFFGRFPQNDQPNNSLPDNSALKEISNGLAKAHQAYGLPSAAILFVVQPDERNVFDQRHLELELFQSHKIVVIRKTLAEVASQAQLKEDNKLYLDDTEISVVYFRSGYAPTDYPTQTEWDGRTLLERSWAIKCPNIAYHLAGSKKIQQVLALPNVLERFLDPEQAQLVRNFFTGLYPLDSTSHGQEAFNKVLANPTNYVLKPSREGGGNNLYGEDIVPFLQTLPEPSRSAYILMDRIIPPRFTDNNIGLRFGQPTLRGHFVSELGIYGIFLADSSKVHSNVVGGHLLRTKLESSNEGGVAVGHSVIDSPYLI